jgi:hypothetical protein
MHPERDFLLPSRAFFLRARRRAATEARQGGSALPMAEQSRTPRQAEHVHFGFK